MLHHRSAFFAVLLMPLLCNAADLVDLTVVTTKGYVTYTVGGEWKVRSMQTKPPKTGALFKIKNPADEGTPDSTTFCILTFETNSPEASATFEKMVSERRVEASTRSKHEAWQVFTWDAMRGKTLYHGRDAVRDLKGAHVLLTFAWPRLSRNPPRYDAQMEATFFGILDSVKGGLGPKPVTGGEVVRHPLEQ